MAPRGVTDQVPSPQSVVVDTCVVSFVLKGDTREEAYRPILQGKLLVLSPMIISELERWALERNWGAARRYAMEQHLKQYVVQPFTITLCHAWAKTVHTARRNGFTISCADAWIAAVAVDHGIPLVTNNATHFQGIGMQ